MPPSNRWFVDLADYADNTGREPADRGWIAAERVARAQSIPIGVSPGKFKLTTLWWCYDGLPAVIGMGGVIEFHNTSIGGLRTWGKSEGATRNSRDLTVHGLIWDFRASPATCFGLFAHGCSGLTVTKCIGKNLATGHGIAIYNEGAEHSEPVERIVLAENSIEAVKGKSDCKGILLSSNLDMGSYDDPTARWIGEFRVATPDRPMRRIDIRDNTITGGYYGISMTGVADGNVSGNTVRRTVRGISMQLGCTDNKVHANHLIDSRSSAIHLAFGSSRNQVTGNSVETAVHDGEGLLQCYVGSVDNRIEENRVESRRPRLDVAGRYGIYFAVQSDGNCAKGNEIIGSYYGAGICIESAWNTATAFKESRAFGNSNLVNSGYSKSGISRLEIADNRLELVDGCTELALYAGTDPKHGPQGVSDVTVSGNSSKSGQVVRVKVLEDTRARATDIRLIQNDFGPSAKSSQFVFPRGRAHFSAIYGNTYINRVDEAHRRIVSENPPNVAVSDHIRLLYAAETDVEDFVGGSPGQRISVLLDGRTRLINSGKLRLREDTDVRGRDGHLIWFERIDSAWVEVSRNVRD